MDCQALFTNEDSEYSESHRIGQAEGEGGHKMKSITLYDRSGLRVTVKGDLTRKEIEILEHEVGLTISVIMRSRKFGGASDKNK